MLIFVNCCLIQDEIVLILAPLVKMWVSLSSINSNKLLHTLPAAKSIEWEQTLRGKCVC